MLEKFFTIFVLFFYSKLFAFESLFSQSEGELAAAAPEHTPLVPLLAIIQHGSAFLVLVFIGLRWKASVKVFLRNPFLWLLILIVLVSSNWSEFPVITQRRSFAFLETCLFAVYFASTFNIKQQLRLVAYTLGITAIISLVFTLGFPSHGLENGVHAGAWRGPFLHKNLFARLMTLSCMVNLLATPINAKERILFFIFSGLSLFLIVLSTSKTALVVGLILFFLFHCYKTFYWQDMLKIPVWLTIFLVGGSLFLWLGLHLVEILSVLGKDLTLSGRTIIWSAALDKIQEHPWLGYGYMGFWYGVKGPSVYIQKVYGTTYVPPHSHNGFLELLIAFGYVGVTLFCLSLFLVLRRAVIAVKYLKTREGLWPLMYLSFLLFYNQTETTLLEHNSIFWMLYFSLALSSFIPQSLSQQLPKYKLCLN